MPRPTIPRTAAELSLKIAQLEEERARLTAKENARRGQLLLEYLAGPSGEGIRLALNSVVSKADRELFAL